LSLTRLITSTGYPVGNQPGFGPARWQGCCFDLSIEGAGLMRDRIGSMVGGICATRLEIGTRAVAVPVPIDMAGIVPIDIIGSETNSTCENIGSVLLWFTRANLLLKVLKFCESVWHLPQRLTAAE